MKANEFIKELGWFEAGLWLSAADSQNMSWLPTDYGSIDVDELGSLLHSEEIIQKIGGLDKAKEVFSEIEVGDYAERLKQAIADV